MIASTEILLRPAAPFGPVQICSVRENGKTLATLLFLSEQLIGIVEVSNSTSDAGALALGRATAIWSARGTPLSAAFPPSRKGHVDLVSIGAGAVVGIRTDDVLPMVGIAFSDESPARPILVGVGRVLIDRFGRT